MKRPSFLLALVTLAACSGVQSPTTDPPAPLPPTLTLTPASINVNAGNPAVSFTASVQNSTETVIWTYAGPGSVIPAGGLAASYTPPEKVETTQSGSLTATLGSTGVTATAPIVIYPANVTPPAEPPPTPDPPANPDPPSNPDPPASPDPPANPDPPATPDPTVTIAEVALLTLGDDGTASADLDASTSNAPGDATYEWTAEGADADNVSFSSPTSEDTTATFSMEGTYTLRLTITAGSKSATATVEVKVDPAPVPVQDVVGLWTSPATADLIEFTLDLKQTGEDVTGTYEDRNFSDEPVAGSFDGTELKLDFPNFPTSTINATVSGDTMTGTWDYPLGSYPFTATRQAAP